MNREEPRCYYRNLPHWRALGATYFVTWNLLPGETALLPDERGLVQSVILHFNGSRFDAVGGVIMDDHVHVIVEPRLGWSLETTLHSWKSFSVNQLQKRYSRIGAVWQPESYDHILRNEADFMEKLTYVRNNPWKRWPDIESYQWMWPQNID